MLQPISVGGIRFYIDYLRLNPCSMADGIYRPKVESSYCDIPSER